MKPAPPATAATHTGQNHDTSPKRRRPATRAARPSTTATVPASSATRPRADRTPPECPSSAICRMTQCWIGKVSKAAEKAQNTHTMATGANPSGPSHRVPRAMNP